MSEPVPEYVEIGDSVIYQDLQNEVVILNMTSQQYYGLDDIGASMWKMLLDRRSLAVVADQLVRDYEVESAVAEKDLESLVRRLLDCGLLKASQV
jgi:hypothetical protein